MEYVITDDRPFEEIEVQTISALERQGFVVQRTFSLRSATTWSEMSAAGTPGYSVLMLFGSDAQSQPLGLVTLYQRGGATVIHPAVMVLPDSTDREVGDDRDAGANLVAALILGGLHFCVRASSDAGCIELEAESAGDLTPQRVRDPVCGQWILPSQAQAAMEHEGQRWYVCCAACQVEFERDPSLYR